MYVALLTLDRTSTHVRELVASVQSIGRIKSVKGTGHRQPTARVRSDRPQLQLALFVMDTVWAISTSKTQQAAGNSHTYGPVSSGNDCHRQRSVIEEAIRN